MLVAKDKLTNKLVYSFEATKDNTYYCPDCCEELILKRGLIKVPHFAHKVKSDCRMSSSGESLEHELIKVGVKRLIEKYNNVKFSSLEYRIDSRIADIYFEIKHYDTIKKVAVEVVHKHEDIKEFKDKNLFYDDNNIFVLWVFNASSFRFNDEQQIKAIWNEAKKLYYGKIFAYDCHNNQMHAIHFDKVYRYNSYALKKTKFINNIIINKFRLTTFEHRDENKKFKSLRCNIATPFVKSWW